MKVLIFGGTFDPPHVGHMDLLRNAIDAVRPDAVVVIPAGIPPHKQASATPAPLRLAMCRCFLSLFPNLTVSEIEIYRDGKSYTQDTVETLRRQYPGSELYLSVGGDMLLSFEKWHNYAQLLDEVTLVVQNRHERQALLDEAAQKLRAQGARLLFTKGDTADISSTKIRQCLAQDESLFQYIPPPADRIVRENNLYREAPDDDRTSELTCQTEA